MSFDLNIVTDYSSPTNGTSNCSAAFAAFKNDVQGQSGILRIPAHTYFHGGTATYLDRYLFAGIPNLVVEGTGAIFTDLGTSSDYHFGASNAVYQDDAHSARLKTASAGQSYLELVTIGDYTKFIIGDWQLVAGIDMQGIGFPMNPHFFEFVQITAIDSGAGILTLSAPLRYGYKSTWPFFNGGSAFEIDMGGPATVYQLYSGWDIAHDYRGLTVVKTELTRKPTNSGGRSIIYRNTTPTNFDGINPSFHDTFHLIDCDFTAVSMEMDKCINEISMTNCAMNSIYVQSSSVNLMTIESGTTFAGFITGTPKKIVITSSTTSQLSPGAAGFGVAEELVGSDSVISEIAIGGWSYQGGNSYIGDSIGVDAGLNTMSAGIIRIPKSYTAKSVSWAIPGAWCMWQDVNRTCIRIFHILDVWDDATYVYVQTSESGSWPSYDHGGILKIQTHGAPKCTVRGCSSTAPAGTDDGSIVYGLNSAPAGAPLWSYAKKVLHGNTNPYTTSELLGYIWGNLVDLKMDVTTAYTGSVNPAKMQPLGWTDRITNGDGSLGDYIPEINIRLSGQRRMQVIAGTPTASGFQSGDAAYTLPEVPMWLANTSAANMMNDIRSDHGSFALTVEVTTDQGIVPVVVGNSTILSDRVLDLGVAVLASETNALFLCSAAPTDYATALAARLSSKTGAIFNSPVALSGGGRKVVSNAITDGSNLAAGTVGYWAAVDTVNLRLLANGQVIILHSVIPGTKFSLPSFELAIDNG